jgi:hypothetical protein
VKRRFIAELRKYWAYHPRYQDLVDNIQGKFSFKGDRPQRSIVVKAGSASQEILSADNYIGTVNSYVFLCKYRSAPGLSIEWVRENASAIQQNGGVFPSPAGIYYVQVLTDPEDPDGFVFFVDSLIEARAEAVPMTSETTAQLAHVPYAGSLRLFEQPSQYLLTDPATYTFDAVTGRITLQEPLLEGHYLVADYRYKGRSSGPHKIWPNHANHTAIPGVVLAFGTRLSDKDAQAVVVQPVRSMAALEYGGRWDVSLDFEVQARDVEDQEAIADQSVIYIYGILRSYLPAEGMEITEVSLGGEGEETYDDNADDYFYTSSFSVTVQTDWFVWVPIQGYIRDVVPLTLEQSRAIEGLSPEELEGMTGNLKMLASIGLEALTDPFFKNKTSTFETIK